MPDPALETIFNGYNDIVRVLAQYGTDPQKGTPTSTSTTYTLNQKRLLEMPGATNKDSSDTFRIRDRRAYKKSTLRQMGSYTNEAQYKVVYGNKYNPIRNSVYDYLGKPISRPIAFRHSRARVRASNSMKSFALSCSSWTMRLRPSLEECSKGDGNQANGVLRGSEAISQKT